MSTPIAPNLFGWVPFAARTREQNEAHEQILASMPRFAIRGLYKDEPGQYFLWKFSQKLNGGKHIRYVWQTTGSCVGAGGANMLRTLAYVEIANGEPELFPQSDLWWLWTYGQSRRRAGLNGKGDGSFGSAWADAIVKDGIFSRDEFAKAHSPLPDFQANESWIRLNANTEYEWSDGKAMQSYAPLGAKHLVKTASPLASSAQAKAAIMNGYPFTIASMFGTRTIRAQGTPAVQLASWDDRWPHQMSCFKLNTIIAGETFKPIQDIRVGDRVLGHDGRFHAVTQLFKRHYYGGMVRLRLAGRCKRTPLTMTPEHPVLIYRPIKVHGEVICPGAPYREDYSDTAIAKHKAYEETQPQWMAASELRVGDQLLMPIPEYPDNPADAVVPLWEYRKGEKKRPLPIPAANDDWAWFFGLYAADGSAVIGHRITICLHEDEMEYAERSIRTLATVGVTARIERVKNKKAIRVVADSSCLARAFAKWFGTNSGEKRLPSFLFTGWNLRAVLDGLWAGDGTVPTGPYKEGVRQFTTSSPILREQAFSILLALGETPSISEAYWKDKPESWATVWNVVWGFKGVRSNCHRWQNYLATPVRSVMYDMHDGDVYNFEVADVNSYTANSVAVHNCNGYWSHPTLGDIFYILNQWGSNAHPAPLNGEPPGGFWIKASTLDLILSSGEGFAFSAFNGFPARVLDWYV